MDQVYTGESVNFGDQTVSLIENKAFNRCRFERISLMPPQFLPQRTTIRNCSLSACHLGKATFLWSSILDEVTIDGLTGSEFQIQLDDTLAFRHVTLTGKIRGMALMRLGNEQVRAAAQQLNQAHYASTDWALDISQAHFTSPPELHGVPAEKVRMNGVSQVVITTESLRRTSEEGLRELFSDDVFLGPMLHLQAGSTALGYSSRIYVAPDSGKDAAKYQHRIELLRSAGLLAVEERVFGGARHT